MYPSRHFPAPPGLQVAVYPSRRSVSTSFSPSTRYTVRPFCIAFSSSGIRYSVRSLSSAGTLYTYPSRLALGSPGRCLLCRKSFFRFPFSSVQ